jgi:hypothetical protein
MIGASGVDFAGPESVGEMAVAYWTVHPPIILPPGATKATAIFFCFVFLLFVFAGPRRLEPRSLAGEASGEIVLT